MDKRPRRAVTAWAALIVFGASMAAGGAWAQAPLDPHYPEMIAAAHAMQAASAILLAEKTARGLLPPPETDPNQTGMIGLEYTTMTTAQGDLESKRTTTNPDFAAAFVKLIAGLNLPRGSPVVLMLSASYIGGNVALVSAVEALGLRPVLLLSAGTSMWGANNPELNLFDVMALLRQRGVIRAHAIAGVLGGTNAYGGGMDSDSVKALRASAEADHVPVITGKTLDEAVGQLVGAAKAELHGEKPGLLINVGGSIVGLGSCLESFTYPPGLHTSPVACTDGSEGVLMKFGDEGFTTLHVIDMRLITMELGLPFDPMPLPEPGKNHAVYGG